MKKPTLTEILAEMREKAGEPYRSRNDLTVQRLVEANVAENALKAGDKAPDFAMIDAEGRVVRSEDLFARGPTVLSFYRGVWCPYCSAELEALHRATADIAAAGGNLVAVTAEQGGRALKVKQQRQFKFEILCDLDNGVGLSCGIVFRLPNEMIELFKTVGNDFPVVYGNDSWFLPMPATYIIGRDGVIKHAYVNPDFRYRLDPEEIVRVLNELR
jgi:peroxiredoxin